MRLSQIPIYANHEIGRVDDPLEHAADYAADEVMNMPGGARPTWHGGKVYLPFPSG